MHLPFSTHTKFSQEDYYFFGMYSIRYIHIYITCKSCASSVCWRWNSIGRKGIIIKRCTRTNWFTLDLIRYH
jgi:hypothetical protein